MMVASREIGDTAAVSMIVIEKWLPETYCRWPEAY